MNPPATASARLLRELRRQGYPARTVNEAIEAGLLTDAEWCTALRDAWEEAGSVPQPSTARAREDSRAAILTALKGCPGQTHMNLVHRLDSRPDVIADTLSLLMDRGYVTARPLPRGSRCALAYYPTEQA